MSTKYLGDQFDIHGGGMDLKFPHHECEIAQGKCSTGKAPVNYWLHANMLTLNGKKMSKSTGNTLLPHELFSGENTLLDKAFHPTVVRFFMMQAHYRSVLDFSSDALVASEKGFYKLMTALADLNNLKSGASSSEKVDEIIESFYTAMNDDFNTPVLVANIFEAVNYINRIKDGNATISQDDLSKLKTVLHGLIFDVLGLTEAKEEGSSKLDAVMNVILEIRKNAREKKDFATSDLIRDRLGEAGIQIKDGKEGVSYSVN